MNHQEPLAAIIGIFKTISASDIAYTGPTFV